MSVHESHSKTGVGSGEERVEEREGSENSMSGGKPHHCDGAGGLHGLGGWDSGAYGSLPGGGRQSLDQFDGYNSLNLTELIFGVGMKGMQMPDVQYYEPPAEERGIPQIQHVSFCPLPPLREN